VQGYLENNLFWFDISKPILHVHSSMSTPLEIWHQRMGHLSYSTLMHYHDSVKGMSFDASTNHDRSPCSGCELGKQSRLPFSTLGKHSNWRLQIVHSDLARLMQVQSIQGTSYIAMFIDDYSRHGVVYFLKTKDQCAAAFKTFLAWAMSRWTIGTILLTNFLSIYVLISHTPAGVASTSLSLHYNPSITLLPLPFVIPSLQIVTNLLLLICRRVSWPYCH